MPIMPTRRCACTPSAASRWRCARLPIASRWCWIDDGRPALRAADPGAGLPPPPAAGGRGCRLRGAQVGTWLDHPSRMDPTEDLLLAEVDGSLVAHVEAGWELDNDGGRNYNVWGQVHPSWRRRGLGTALLRWNEERQRQVGASHPAGGERRLQSWADEGEAGRLALLEGR